MTNSTNSIPTFDPSEHPHRRFNPLKGEHVLVSPHRTKRPWKGQTDPPVVGELPQHDPECYLCPGNTRSGGFVNPKYEQTYTFPNDFPALLPDPLPNTDNLSADENESNNASSTTGRRDQKLSMFTSTPVRGSCKVICFHPRHDLTLARMEVEDIVKIVEEWRRVYVEEGQFLRSSGSDSKEGEGVVGADEEKEQGYVQIFENRGAMMGASAPHPHGQVWSLSYIPDEPATELRNMSKYLKGNPDSASHSHLLLEYAKEEVERKERLVEIDEAGGWIAVVPFWATWPFEIMVLPYKRQIPSLCQLTLEEIQGLSRILKKVLVRYDNLFSCPFPYSFGLHQSPLPPIDPSKSIAQIHFHFYPPLLRSASVRKFLVGFEMMGEAQRDLTPEQAAGRLRALSDVHYLDQ